MAWQFSHEMVHHCLPPKRVSSLKEKRCLTRNTSNRTILNSQGQNRNTHEKLPSMSGTNKTTPNSTIKPVEPLITFPVVQNLRSPRLKILADGHSYDMCPLPPHVSQMMVAMQLRLMCPGWPQMRQRISRNGPPCISEARVVFGQVRAT